MNYRIALGTTSVQKIGYLEKELVDLGLKYELRPVDVPSGVSDQPMTDEETRSGSSNRAQGAFKASVDCDFGMGIEVGYDQNGEGYDIFCWVTIFDSNGNHLSHKSEHVVLPDFHVRTLRDGKYLGDHVQIYLDKVTTEEERRIGESLKTREPFIREAIRRSLQDYLSW